MTPPDSAPRVSGAVGAHRFEARAGHHLAPAVLSDGRDVYATFDAGYTLLALGADETAVAHFRAAAEAMGLPLKVVRGERTGEAGRYAAPLVLVRPDQFAAWAGTDTAIDAATARAILATARGRSDSPASRSGATGAPAALSAAAG